MIKVKFDRKRAARIAAKIFIHLFMIAAVLCMVMPFFVTFMVTFKTGSDVYRTNIFPTKFYWKNYAYVLKNTTIIKAFFNTIAYIIPPLFVGVICSAMAAYALSRIPFKGRELVFSALFATVMIPGIITLIPSYVMFANFYHWVNTPLPLIIPGMFGGVMVMFYLRQFMMGLPKELEEAAFIDGMNRGGVFFKIILPLSKPALIAQVVLSFSGFYNDLMGPLMYINTAPKYYTVQLVVNTLNSEYGAVQERLLAACFLALVPTFVIFAVAQKYFIEGMAVSGIKG